MLRAATFASNPRLPGSMAAFLTRNVAAISVALKALGDGRPLRIALIGSGVFEPLTTANSRMPADSVIVAFDVSGEVVSLLNSMLTGKLVSLQELAERHSSWGWASTEDSGLFREMGIDDARLFHRPNHIGTGLPESQTLVALQQDVSVVDWRLPEGNWDLIVCNNLLPNLSLSRGQAVVPRLMDVFYEAVAPDGLCLVGTTDSHWYGAGVFPAVTRHFGGELRRCVEASSWSLAAIAERVFVRERDSDSLFLDGYTYFFLGKDNFPSHRLCMGLGKEEPDWTADLEHFDVDANNIFDLIYQRHLIGAFRVGRRISGWATRLPFPTSVAAAFEEWPDDVIEWNICEKVMRSQRSVPGTLL